MSKKHPRSSRQRYRIFVEDYRHRRLDDKTEADGRAPAADQPPTPDGSPKKRSLLAGKRREYLREYVGWLRPHRYAVAFVFLLSATAAGLQMIEPLFMRYIVDRVLLNAALDSAARLGRLNVAGAAFVAVILASNLLDAFKDYRQRLLNTRVMLSLRRALYERLINLPLPRLHDMKTGGILSRLTGDVDTTTGLLQMAVMSPGVSIIRLLVGIIVLLTLNWRL